MNGVLADRSAAEQRFRAAYDLLRRSPPSIRIGSPPSATASAARSSLHAARIGLPLRGVVSFHGALGSFHKPAPGSVKAKVLVCHGAADNLVPSPTSPLQGGDGAREGRLPLRRVSGRAPRLHQPGRRRHAKHTASRSATTPRRDRRSWQDMPEFLARVLA